MNEANKTDVSSLPPAFSEEEMKAEAKSNNKNTGLPAAFPEEEIETKLTLENFDVDDDGNLVVAGEEDDDLTDDDKETSDDVEKEEDKEKPAGDDKIPPKEEESKSPDTSKADDIPAISQAALDRAVSLGIPLEAAKNFGSEQQLTGFLDRQSKADQGEDSPKEPEKPKEEDADDPYVPLSEDDYDPVVIELHKKNWELRQEIKDIKQKTERVETYESQQRQERLMNDFDNLTNSSPDEFKDYLGKGSLKELKQDSSEYQNRVKLMNHMAAVAQGYKATGQTPPSMNEIFKGALHSLFPEALKKTSEKELQSQLKKETGKFAHRPRGRSTNNNKQLDGKARAVQLSKEFDRKLDEEGY